MIRVTTTAIALAGTLLFAPSTARGQCTAVETATMVASPGAAGDQFGHAIAVDGDTAVVGAWLNTNSNGAAAGAAYVYQRDLGGRNAWGFVKQLIASSGAPDDAFGFSVAIHGDTIVVGSYRDDTTAANAGAAYVFERDLGGVDNWGESKKLLGSSGAMDDQFGWSVAIERRPSHRGRRAPLGRSTMARRTPGPPTSSSGTPQATGSRTRGERTEARRPSDAAANDWFGSGRGAHQRRHELIVGASGDDDAWRPARGAAYVFERECLGVS